MTFRQRLGLAARRWARRLGRGLLWTGVIALFLWKAPIIPYSPTCSEDSFATGTPIPAGFSLDLSGHEIIIEGPMTTAFVDRFTKSLNWWEVSYLRIGNNVFLSFWTELSGGNDGLINANNRALDSLWPQLRAKDAPTNLRARLKRLNPPDGIYDDCALARAIAIENFGRGE